MMQGKKAVKVGSLRLTRRLKVLLVAFGICLLGLVILSLGFPQGNVIVLFRFDGEAAYDNLGYSVSTAGDVNGDGYADLLVGAPGANSYAGRAYVLSFIGEPDIAVEPTTVGYGAVKIGQQKTKSFIIRNEGNATLQISDITGFAPPFYLVSPAPPFSVAPGANVEVKVRFQPTTRGEAKKTITIFSNDPDEPQVNVLLKGY
jgi:hypothetical protein